jgi:small subunit ribosomal protein S7
MENTENTQKETIQAPQEAKPQEKSIHEKIASEPKPIAQQQPGQKPIDKAPLKGKILKKDYHKDQIPISHTHESKPIYVKKKSQFSDYKLFNKWPCSEVIVTDISLAKYINLDPIITPHTFGRKNRGRFEKATMNIVERLVNKMMRSGQGKRKLSGKFLRGRGSCGKKLETMKIVEKAFEIVEKQTKQNPIQVLVKAIENAAPREDVTRIKKGGVAYTLAVDLAPMKRLDESVKNIALGGFGASFNKKTSAEQALADEMIAAASNDLKSVAIKRKDEVERIAKASR